MNNIFDFRRFGKYFTYDLVNARNNYWLSLLITGFLPAISYVISQLMCRLFTGEWFEGALAAQISSFAASMIVVSMGFPSKAYGSLTERKAGASWLMVPASPFEKFLSMTLICCIVLPVCLALLLCGSDALMSLIFPSYGTPLIHYIWNVNDYIAQDVSEALSVNVINLAGVSWATSILPFLFGAIFFKKSKVAKTVLALIVLSLVLSSLSSILMHGVVLDVEEWLSFSDATSFEQFFQRFNVLMNIISVLYIGAFLVLTYIRVRTIKL